MSEPSKLRAWQMVGGTCLAFLCTKVYAVVYTPAYTPAYMPAYMPVGVHSCSLVRAQDLSDGVELQ